MAEKVASGGFGVGMSGTAEKPRFTLKIGGAELAGDFLAPRGDDRDLSVWLEREPDGDAEAPERASYKLVVSSGSDREEHEGLTLKAGGADIAGRVNAASKLIKLEETGAVQDE